MRFKLKLQVQAEKWGRKIPLNYQYELSSAIYNILSKSSSGYAYWLHENGFSVDNKKFKLFTFSHLVIPRYSIDRENQRLVIQSDFVEWYLTFLPEKSTQRFVEGIFMQQHFQLGDRYSKVEFWVREVEMMPPILYKEEMCFETLSPICVSQRLSDGKTKYLSPIDSNYTAALLTGLTSRYKAFYGKNYEGVLFCDFHLLSEPKPVLIKMKADTPEQTLVRGYKYKFKIRLPESLMRIMIEAGAGEKGSMGWGMIREIPSLR